MKRIAICSLLLAALCGCGFLRESSYVVVTPHNEEYGVSLDSNVLTVSSYLSLKNAILSAVQDCSDEIVIRAESYSGNLGEDLNQAIYEVTKLSPLGAYAVNNMTYDYSRIVSYYEININVTYKRTREEIQEIVYVTDMDAVRESLEASLAQYEFRLILRVGDYDSLDLADEVAQILRAHPEFSLEQPETVLELYPESGTQRILDMKFTYLHSLEELTEYREAMQEQIKSLVTLYGSSNSEMTNARRLYQNLGRDVSLDRQENPGTISDGAYGALLEDHSGSYGFAQAYSLLMDACGIPCQLISGQKNGMLHYWCLVEIDGNPFYVDPSVAAGGNDASWFLMDNADMARKGYFVMNPEEYPVVELPWYLVPPVVE